MKGRCLREKCKSYPSYGGRGILVAAEWLASFDQFLAHVGKRPSPDHSLDRYPDNDGGYEPGNVRWATREEQARNTRKVKLSGGDVVEIRRLLADGGAILHVARAFGVAAATVARIRHGRGWKGVAEDVEIPAKDAAIEFRGARRSREEMCAEFGIPRKVFNLRMAAQWSLEKALSTPVRPRRIGRDDRLFGHNGERKTISEWAAARGISRDVLAYRLNHGWDVAKAIETPVMPPSGRRKIG